MSDARPDLRVFASYQRDFTEEADVVVVGSGPGGAVVARELTQAGQRVVLIEEGPPFTPADYEIDGGLSMARTLREGGLRTTSGTIMPTMQAIALGGGSLVNSAICNRAPDFVLDQWCSDFELERTAGSRIWRSPLRRGRASSSGIAPDPRFRAGSAQPALSRRLRRAGLPERADRAKREAAVAAAASASLAAAPARSSRWTSPTYRTPCA